MTESQEVDLKSREELIKMATRIMVESGIKLRTEEPFDAVKLVREVRKDD